MILFDSHAGITFSSVKIKITEIQKKDNQFFITNVDEVYFNHEIDFEKDKETKISSLFNSAFDELMIRNSITSNGVSVSLPQELFVTARLPNEPALLNSDTLENLKLQMSLLYPHLNWNDYVLNYLDVDSSNTSLENNAIVFALNRKFIKIISTLCEKFNLKLKFIDHSHLTSNNILTNLLPVGVDSTLSFYLSQKILSVLLSEKGKPVYYQDIPIIYMSEVQSLITDEINKLKSSGVNFTDCYLFGEAISNRIAETLSKATSVNFIIVNPFTQLQPINEVMTNKFYTDSNHFFTASAGLAIRI